MDIHLLIIDPQNDFCSADGSLSVTGADEDMKRLSSFIEANGKKMDIHVTMDTHHLFDIAHPIFWMDGDGNEPKPFTIITEDDVKDGKWRAKNPVFQKTALEYVQKLTANDRYPLCIWPPHCLIGTPGHNIFEDVMEALLNWEGSFGTVDYVTKGSNMFTEHYSAVMADVEDSADPTTALNTRLIDILEKADMVFVAGEASSHCVANTMTDIIDNFGEDSAKKVTLLTDCMSPVPGFEALADNFFDDMKKRGVKLEKSTDVLGGA